MTCLAESCTTTSYCKGYCTLHFQRVKKYGTPDTPAWLHGLTKSPEYRTWQNMKTRCFYPSSNSYKYYGARGITICDEWLDFRNFYRDMGQKPSPHHSIERIDNDGDYCPENCVWATRHEQNLNKRPRYSVFR